MLTPAVGVEQAEEWSHHEHYADHDGDPASRPNPQDGVSQCLLALAVEIGVRLVENDQKRTTVEGTRQGEPLALSVLPPVLRWVAQLRSALRLGPGWVAQAQRSEPASLAAWTAGSVARQPVVGCRVRRPSRATVPERQRESG